MKKKILAMIMIMTMGIATLLTGCGSNGGDGQGSGSQSGSNGNDPSKVLVLKVGDQDVYMDAVNYYAIALVEAMGLSEGTDVTQKYNESYDTLDAAMKAQLLLQIRQAMILYQKAEEMGITLDDSDKTEVSNMIAQYKESHDADKLQKFGLTDEALEKVYTQYKTISKMEEQLQSDSMSTGDVVEYGTIETLAFLTVEVDDSGNAVTDSDGNYKKLSDDEIAAAKAKAEEALEKAKNGESFEDLIDEYDLSSTSGTTHATTESLKEAYQLEDGQISDVMETDFGYTIVHMVSQKDDEYTGMVQQYNAQQAVKDQEQSWFDGFFIQDSDVVEKVWNAFTFQDFV